ncbi:lysosomal acid glucosylceramidase-like [Littorina saxatilis]|uniref:Glucosylceramidase n=1 Tax=Littorina saxatilis TaxID=31220 RepID=A0AAN9C7R0_9CAEN
MIRLFLLCVASFVHAQASQPCVSMKVSSYAMVCVCNSTYCDTVPQLPTLTPGMFAAYTSSQSGDRFQLATAKVTDTAASGLVLEINKNVTRQTIIGFGGAFTDAAGINIASLPQAAQEKLIQSYFASDGLEYTIGRIPMASCDFSTHPYSYDDVAGDLNLTHFALAQEDLKLKIPYIKQALNLTNSKLRMFGSPWSAPAWMKTNGNMTGNGTLIGQPGGPYFKTWANYFVRFVEEYSKQGIPIWGLTTQNEPADGNIYRFPFQAMGWTPETQRDFVKMDLGPALRSNKLQHVQLMIMDDQRLMLPYWAKVIYADPEALQYISGVAVHWYIDQFVPINVLDFTHELQPNKFIFGSEACSGDLPWEADVSLGDWSRGEKYASDIIGDLNHWVTGWTDWNIALDLGGGPNWVKNFVDSPIIVNASRGEFYKQPMFYAMGHFSKFLVPGSVHVELKANIKNDIQSTAFLRPDGSLAVVLLNTDVSPVTLSVHDTEIGYLDITISGKSIKTLLWKNK